MSPSEVDAVVVQARRYHYAGEQDLDPVVRFMHLNYAKGLLDMLIFLSDRPAITKAIFLRPGMFPSMHTFDSFYGTVAKAEGDALAHVQKLVTR
jgi:hypothetical protein